MSIIQNYNSEGPVAKADNTVTYKETNLYTAEESRYEVLMSGTTLVTRGFMNKTQKVMNTIMPDSAIAANMHKQMESGMKEDGRLKSSHPASQRERSSINSEKEGMNGYY